MDFFDVNTILFTFLGYDMSYLEFFGTFFNILAVYFAVKNNILTWLSTLVAVTFFGFLFYQFQLYSDVAIQIFYFGTGIAGLIAWSQHKRGNKTTERKITRNSTKQNLFVIAGVLIGTAIWGTFMSNIHEIFPSLEPAAYPYVDAAIAFMAIFAQIQLIFRKLENWMLWILMDIIAIGVYYSRGVKLVAVLYVIFLGLSIAGLISWRKQISETKSAELNPQGEAV